MISEKESKNNEVVFNFEEVEQIYEIIEHENVDEVLPNYDLQDEKLTKGILEVYKMLFWGIFALSSTLLWLYFLIN